MLPFSITFIVAWSLFLFGWTALELPLGPGSSYTYPPTP
jgi:aminobenzoyl-glutamate transport protein